MVPGSARKTGVLPVERGAKQRTQTEAKPPRPDGVSPFEFSVLPPMVKTKSRYLAKKSKTQTHPRYLPKNNVAIHMIAKFNLT